MKNNSLDDATVQGVVEHMNDDHSDACLAIVQAFGNLKDTRQARMISMDSEGADFLAADYSGVEQPVRVAFDKPISRDSQIRGHMVALTKRAKALLGN